LGILLALLASGITSQGAEASHESTPSSLVNAARTSPDVVEVGDVASMSWELGDVPATAVAFTLVDGLGKLHYLRWNHPNGAFSGTATATVDDTWTAGVIHVVDVLITGANGSSRFYSVSYPDPTGGMKPPPHIDFTAFRFTVVHPTDTSTAPSLMGFTRTSPDNAEVGDTVTVDWEVADVPD
jgi:hypothetical protein